MQFYSTINVDCVTRYLGISYNGIGLKYRPQRRSWTKESSDPKQRIKRSYYSRWTQIFQTHGGSPCTVACLSLSLSWVTYTTVSLLTVKMQLIIVAFAVTCSAVDYCKKYSKSLKNWANFLQCDNGYLRSDPIILQIDQTEPGNKNLY
jgi:hypothetical protein